MFASSTEPEALKVAGPAAGKDSCMRAVLVTEMCESTVRPIRQSESRRTNLLTYSVSLVWKNFRSPIIGPHATHKTDSV